MFDTRLLLAIVSLVMITKKTVWYINLVRLCFTHRVTWPKTSMSDKIMVLTKLDAESYQKSHVTVGAR